MTRPTDNAAKLPFIDLPRDVQDKIAGAIARGEFVEIRKFDKSEGEQVWAPISASTNYVHPAAVYRLPPAPQPAKDPNRPRPLHKLGVNYGDVVKLVARQDGSTAGVGLEFTVGLSGVVEFHMWNPAPKGHRPLFVIVSRAGGEA